MNEVDFPLSLGFDDVAIIQKKNCVTSRLDVDISSEIVKGVKVKIPLIASNMSSVINAEFLIKILELGAFGFLHRALPEEVYLKEVDKVVKSGSKWVPVSVGVGEKEWPLINQLHNHGANIFLIDVAHGYADTVIQLGKRIKHTFPDAKVVLGNTNNLGLLEEASDFADGIKVGIGGGLGCSTATTAGCTEKQFSAVYKFKDRAYDLGMPIISDGGTKIPSDFVKAIGAGASSVMAGSIFARCPESAAETVRTADDPPYLKKVYYGMASKMAQDAWKGGLKPRTCAEGKTVYLDLGEPVEALLERYEGALRSGITYGGGFDIESFQNVVEFVRFR